MKKITWAVLSSSVILSGAFFVDVSAFAIKKPDSVVIQVIPDNPYAALNWEWPTDVNVVTGAYGESRPDGPHKGIDIGAFDGHNVVATQAGKVLSSGIYTDGTKYVTIQTNDRVDTAYNLITRELHLQSYSVIGGNTVTKGQIVGLSGQSGGVDPHLHFDVNDQGKLYPSYLDTVNPEYFWPYRFTSTSSVSSLSTEPHSAAELEAYADSENFFDHYLIQYVGEDKFYQWFNAIPQSERKLSNFKKHFGISNKLKNEILEKGKKLTEEREKSEKHNMK